VQCASATAESAVSEMKGLRGRTPGLRRGTLLNAALPSKCRPGAKGGQGDAGGVSKVPRHKSHLRIASPVHQDPCVLRSFPSLAASDRPSYGSSKASMHHDGPCNHA
jgi:hypothetical protein